MSPELCVNERKNNTSSGKQKQIMLVAGEASGDLHGGNLVRAMLQIDPTLKFYGVGGKNLKEAGVDLIADSADIAVVGLTEVFSKLRTIIKVMRHLKASIKSVKPDLVILIDYPDFNLSIAKTAKRHGVKVFYYISPQVWAWRKGRIKKIKKIIDKMVVILPFEAGLYQEAGVDVTFVGHPLLDTIRTNYSREEALSRFGLREGVTTVGILPGSRQSEVVRLLPEMLKAAEIIEKKIHTVQFVLPIADTLDNTFVTRIIEQYPVTVSVIRGEVYDVIHCADIAMVASGTATLETALIGTPMIIVYKVSTPSYYIGKMVINVAHIGMVNILAGKRIVPEFVQDEACPEKIATEVIDILINRKRMDYIKAELIKIRNMLGSPGAAKRAAHLAYNIL